jgi:integrase
MKPSPGIRRRHSAGCPVLDDSDSSCKCSAGYEAAVFDPKAGRKLRRSFPNLAAARSWRADAEQGVRRGTIRASEPVTVNDAADQLVAGMEAGSVRTRSGDVYKPSAIRGYRAGLDSYVRQDLGAMRLQDVRRRHVQALADRLVAEGLSPSSVRNALMPLRVIFRRALRDELVVGNPCDGLDLPANRGRRDRIVAADHAADLLDALTDTRDRAVWATALYAGLRRGELMALRWADIDLASGAVHVERSYDPRARVFVEPKSRAGRRRVPMAGALRDTLVVLRLDRADAAEDELAFGDNGRPFAYEPLLERTREAWRTANLDPVGLHEARHTAASLMIAAGVNVKALSEFLGHASITITLDRYGHLLPGSIAEATALLDAFLAGAAAARAEEQVPVGK